MKSTRQYLSFNRCVLLMFGLLTIMPTLLYAEDSLPGQESVPVVMPTTQEVEVITEPTTQSDTTLLNLSEGVLADDKSDVVPNPTTLEALSLILDIESKTPELSIDANTANIEVVESINQGVEVADLEVVVPTEEVVVPTEEVVVPTEEVVVPTEEDNDKPIIIIGNYSSNPNLFTDQEVIFPTTAISDFVRSILG